MNNLESYTLSTKKQCDYLSQKIANHTPPKTQGDERLIQTYRRLLIRDRTYLHNLELLKTKEALDISSTSDCESSLNLDEIKLLLDENSEL
ncbi:MAG: hypothetical protein ABW170_21575 [Candidatus Thiodiazotropha sp. L084R]